MYYFTKPYKDEPIDETVVTYDSVIKEVNGVKVQMFVPRTEDLNKGLSYSDFSLKSLIDADAIDLLNPIAPISRTPLYAADIANIAANNIGTVLDNVKVENKVESPKTDVTNE